MTSFPAVKGKDLISALRGEGLHAGETLGPGLLASILRDLKLTREQLQKLL